jgi:hypothetical protein
MGEIHQAPAVLRFVAVFSQHEAALEWAEQEATSVWGVVALKSAAFSFDATDYYEASMGPGLRKQFWAFEQLADPGKLADWKLAANRWEKEYAEIAGHDEPRPLNIDPGYLTLGKLVLASTKDHAHRIYLRDGIYAETTLYYKDKQWQAREWTFADYRREDYHAFFDQCREYLKQRLRKEPRA